MCNIFKGAWYLIHVSERSCRSTRCKLGSANRETESENASEMIISDYGPAQQSFRHRFQRNSSNRIPATTYYFRECTFSPMPVRHIYICSTPPPPPPSMLLAEKSRACSRHVAVRPKQPRSTQLNTNVPTSMLPRRPDHPTSSFLPSTSRASTSSCEARVDPESSTAPADTPRSPDPPSPPANPAGAPPNGPTLPGACAAEAPTCRFPLPGLGAPVKVPELSPILGAVPVNPVPPGLNKCSFEEVLPREGAAEPGKNRDGLLLLLLPLSALGDSLAPRGLQFDFEASLRRACPSLRNFTRVASGEAGSEAPASLVSRPWRGRKIQQQRMEARDNERAGVKRRKVTALWTGGLRQEGLRICVKMALLFINRMSSQREHKIAVKTLATNMHCRFYQEN